MTNLPSATEAPTPQIAPSSASSSEFATPSVSRTATPVSTTPEKAPDDSSKIKTLLGILRRFMGVSDIAAVRFSLPAQLMEPIPNLEYWHYLDRPDAFCAIGDSDDPLGRMLQCLRFWFTKDLKYVKAKPVKPYNSALGEFFRCQWAVDDASPALMGNDTRATAGHSGKVKVNYLTEQTSHHPPVSAYYIDCPEKGISAYGYDQISAKFTGTSIKVTPGSFNLGIYITLHKWADEEYHLTHPTAYLGGILRGSLNVTVGDFCIIECQKTGLKALLQYVEEGWLGKNQNRIQGVIFRCNPATDKTSRLKDVSDKDIVGRLEGAWHDKVWFSPGSTSFDKTPDKNKILLIDNTPLFPIPKNVPPMEAQLANESRRFWAPVTEAIQAKQFSLATSAKQEIEERQRSKAADREKRNTEWTPRFFVNPTDPSGRPTLSADGRSALDGLEKGDFKLAPGQDA